MDVLRQRALLGLTAQQVAQAELLVGEGAVEPLKAGTELFKNEEVRVWSLDGEVLIASIHSKMHAISPDVAEALDLSPAERTEILDDQHVRITRLIDGPQELVWRAHHEPALMGKWMLGPDGWQMVECTVGDTYRYVWQQGDDESTRFGFEGETVLSEPQWREVTTEKMIGMDGPGTLNDMELYEEDGVTLLTLVIEYPDKDTRDMILATGMTDGMEASYARLEETVLAAR